MTDSIIPRMHWDDPDRLNAIKIFHQQCELYFSVKNVAPSKQVDHILLFAGATGLTLYNPWGLPDDHKKNLKTVLTKFETQLHPKTNFRVARLYLQRYVQQENESADDFISRLKLQAYTCHMAQTVLPSTRFRHAPSKNLAQIVVAFMYLSHGKAAQLSAVNAEIANHQKHDSSRYKRKPHRYQQHKKVNSIDSSAQSTQLDEAFETLQLDEIVVSNISTLSKDERKDSAMTYVEIKRDENTIVRLRSKVDTGADGNTLPLRMYRKMFPSHLAPDGDPDRANVHHTDTKLTSTTAHPSSTTVR